MNVRLFRNNKYHRYRVMFNLNKKHFNCSLILFGYQFNWYYSDDKKQLVFYKYNLYDY